MPQLDRDGNVYVLNLGDGENRFHPDWVGSVMDAFAEVATASGPRALVTTATGKFFSNGLDLDWLSRNGEQLEAYIGSIHTLFARALTSPVPTVAAIGGHAYAGGGMLALAHDFRIMRADRGFFCLPEVSLQIPFTPGMSAMIQARLTPQVAHEVMTTGRRYGGVDAQSAAIVDRAVAQEAVFSTAVELASSLTTKAGDTMETIKTRMYGHVLAALGDVTAM